MQSVPPIFPVLGGYIVDGSLSITKTYPTTGILGNIGYEFSVTMYIEQLRTISGNTGNGVVIFDTSYIKPGQWILQSNGNCFLITTINVITDSNNISINLRDVDLFNALSSNTRTKSYPITGGSINTIIFSLSEDGDPILNYLSRFYTSGLQDISYWINDGLGRFQHRNYYQEYFINKNIDNYGVTLYSNYNISL